MMVQMNNVSSQYRGGAQALKNVDFSVQEGDFLVLFGSDNAGKTTLLHILMGFNTSYSGKVLLMGKRPNTMGVEQRECVRFVPDSLIVEPGMKGADYLQYAKESTGAYDESLQWELCEEFAVPLQKELKNMTEQENKLIQVIGAVCARPKLLILDEPSDFLGESAYALLLAHLVRWNKAGMAVLLAVEQYEDAKGCGNRYAYLREGRMIASGSVPLRGARGKVVTVVGGKEAVLQQFMQGRIGSYGDRTVYYYRGDMKKLALGLYHADGTDWSVEELTLQEELDGNLTRWESRSWEAEQYLAQEDIKRKGQPPSDIGGEKKGL